METRRRIFILSFVLVILVIFIFSSSSVIKYKGKGYSVRNQMPTPIENIATVDTPILCEVRASMINPPAFGGNSCDYPTSPECFPLERGNPEVLDQINELLNQLQSAQLNTLFVASPSLHGNCGWANVYAFEDFIERAQKKGFSLHLWVSSKERSDPGCNDSQVDYVDPQEKYRQANWIMSLMQEYGRYFDGVHLDYIRYSNWERINQQKMGDKDAATGEEIGVTATIRQISSSLREHYPKKKLTVSVKTLEPDYSSSIREGNSVSWQEDVPQWFQEWNRLNPGNWYSATNTNYATVPLQMKYQQDAISWLREELIDGLIVMQYTDKDDVWNQELEYWKTFTNYKQHNFEKVFMGLGWNYQQDPEHIVRKIKYGRDSGVKGFSIFQFSAWNSALNNGRGGLINNTPVINALTIDSIENNFQAPYKDTISSCLATP